MPSVVPAQARATSSIILWDLLYALSRQSEQSVSPEPDHAAEALRGPETPSASGSEWHDRLTDAIIGSFTAFSV